MTVSVNIKIPLLNKVSIRHTDTSFKVKFAFKVNALLNLSKNNKLNSHLTLLLSLLWIYSSPYRHSTQQSTIADKICETMSRNQAKLDRTRKLWNLLLHNFWPLVPNFYLQKEDWGLGSVSYHFCDIPNIY